MRYHVGGAIESVTIMERMKPFYLYDMADPLIVFSVVALANGLLYPSIRKVAQAAGGDE